MDWCSVVSAIVGSAIPLGFVGLLGFLARNWILIRLRESVSAEYRKDLESFRHDLKKELIESQRKYDEERVARRDQIDADRRLYAKLLEELPPSGSISYLRLNDVAGAIRHSRLNQLDEFELTWDIPTHEFISDTLEQARKRLLRATHDFMDSYSRLTFDTGNIEIVRIPAEWQTRDPERYFSATKELRESARTVVDSYDDLIRICRSSLLI